MCLQKCQQTILIVSLYVQNPISIPRYPLHCYERYLVKFVTASAGHPSVSWFCFPAFNEVTTTKHWYNRLGTYFPKHCFNTIIYRVVITKIHGKMDDQWIWKHRNMKWKNETSNKINKIKQNKYKQQTTFLMIYSLSGKTSYHQISWSLEAARLDIMSVSLWNLTDIVAELLLGPLSNCRAIGKVQTRISRLRDFTRPCDKTPARLVNRALG